MTEKRWAELTEWPLIGAALAFLAAYAVSVLVNPEGTGGVVTEIVMVGTWVLFAVDFAVRLALARPRGRWLFTHWYELVVIALPMLRPLRLLRLMMLLSIMHRSAGTAVRGQVIAYAAGSTSVLLIVSSLAILDAERGAPGASIETYGQALWWAVVTVTTVGYGDIAPVTPTGRMIATGLMLAGIALLGVVTATLASWIVDRVSEQDEVNQSATQAQVSRLSADIAALREDLARLGAVTEGGSGRADHPATEPYR
ncbi:MULTISPECIES: potassium channel family protein [unclassified Dietzia]|uniref:potassium channel family protein n=1 Tax=unclassified Dietzia TaxID=2617939 RepID=UPI00189162C1|nr:MULTISPECIES: potassium channel family protein [unclassified Dietzia]